MLYEVITECSPKRLELTQLNVPATERRVGIDLFERGNRNLPQLRTARTHLLRCKANASVGKEFELAKLMTRIVQLRNKTHRLVGSASLREGRARGRFRGRTR